jgi:hypothetical protein
MSNGYDYFRQLPYTYDYLSDGRKINLLERRLYSAVSENYPDPFSTPGDKFYAELRKKRLSGTTTNCVRNQSVIVRLAKLIMKILLKIAGPERYAKIIRHFNIVGRLRGHTFLLD